MRYLIREIVKKWRRQKKEEITWENKSFLSEPEQYENPYLDELRGLIAQAIQKRGITYAKFAPIIIEGEEPEESLRAAMDLAQDINEMTIIAKDHTYYEDFADNMYEEHGLLISMWQKEGISTADILSNKISGNVIIDFEKTEQTKISPDVGEKLYIPIHKRKWESRANLDIAVPIGYNTVIVKREQKENNPPAFDRLEQAFYENK